MSTFNRRTNNPTNITIQDISKTEFKFKGSIDMVTSTSKHDITKEKHKHCTLKLNNKKNLIMIEENLDNDIINDDVINYWHKDLQLLVNDENVLNPYKWLNDRHMVIAMQMLYVQKLEMLYYQQHTYAIIGTIHRYLSKCL